MNSLVDFSVTHIRKSPLRYQFTHKFFWFGIELMRPAKGVFPFVGINRRGLYSFWDKDHIQLGEESLKENYLGLLSHNGIRDEVNSMKLFTNFRFLGYVFNPVSFVIIELKDGRQCGIIEIGNTFNEIKPYFIPPDRFASQGFQFETKKNFYISPFLRHDNTLKFHFARDGERLSINVSDWREGEKIVDVYLRGVERPFTILALVKRTCAIPFITLKVISLIHFHALILWVRGVPFLRKNEFPEHQKGAYPWKTSSHE